MKYWNYRGLVVLLLGLLLWNTPVWAVVEITAPGEQQLRMAMTPLLPLEGQGARSDVPRAFAAALQDDLTLSGLLYLVPEAAFPADAGRLGLISSEVDFAGWRLLNLDALFKGGYSLVGDELVVEARLYDPLEKRLLIGKRYRGKLGDERRMAHAFADQVLLALSGSEGMFNSRVAFVSTASGQKELYLMDVDGLNLARLTEHRSIVLSPDFSPVAKELIFTSYKAGNPDLFRKEIYTGSEVRLSARPGVNIAGRYRPDGKEIVLTLSQDGDSDLYLLGTDGSLRRRLTDDRGIDVDPCWSPNGERIAFVSDRLGAPQLFLLDVASGVVNRLTQNGRYNVTPDWSPRGDRIVFARLEDKRFDLYTIRPDGSDERRLTDGPGNKEHPRWSRDGRFIVYSSDQDGSRAIYLMRADGSAARKISPPGLNGSHPAWSGHW